ncbi:hypothetical protein J6590_015271 [Homalodisca vitripennis]|nr:hypothetical protein J6590_015271 [Homalodisca vitripennis]
MVYKNTIQLVALRGRMLDIKNPTSWLQLTISSACLHATEEAYQHPIPVVFPSNRWSISRTFFPISPSPSRSV